MAAVLPHDSALSQRSDLKKYGPNARLLFALETRFRLPDVHTIATDALTDGHDDKKCDLVFVDRKSGYAVIAQGYEATKKKDAAPANKASDLNTAVTWLLSRPLKDLPPGLQPAAEAIRSGINAGEIRAIEVWFVHNLKESKNVQAELRTVESTLQAVLHKHFRKAEISDFAAIEVGQSTLEEWYLALEATILVTDAFRVDVPGAYLVSGDNWSAAVTSVPAAWLHELWKKKGSKLFSANVRDYLGSRKSDRNVNHNIKLTAEKSPRKFWAYNNGITALVNDFKIIGENAVELTGLSIVNGAQTTGAIGSLKEPPDPSAFVQARFVKCTDIDTVQEIIQCNNTQNVVEAADFRSNDPIQKRLREQFKDIPDARYLGGRRGGEADVIKRPGNLMPTDTCSQALAAFHQEPGTAYNRKSEIWESDSIYSKYFKDDTTAQHIVFAYSLLRAVERKKMELVELSQSSLSDTQQRQLSVLRNRGATFMLATGIASCIEIFLGRPVANKFRLHFGQVSPDKAIAYWLPVVNATVPFVKSLEPAIKAGLTNREAVATAVENFQSMVEATRSANTDVFAGFTALVKE